MGRNNLVFRRLVILGDTIEVWHSTQSSPRRRPRERLVRQSGAIGPESDAKLASTTVAVIGVSGGGSHVIQQLAHQGVGNLMAIDDQLVEESNLGRLIGATEADIDITPKTTVAHRTAHGIDSSINLTESRARFPSSETIASLKEADIIVACLDTFRAREAINAFCRRYLIPLIDIGIAIRSQAWPAR